ILRTLQPELEIGDASDAFEQEADQVAERVMQVSTAGVIAASPGVVQRKCSCGGSEKCDKCREDDLLQRSAASSAKPAEAPPSVAKALREPGRRLDPAARAFMEPRFGHDFGHVRIHTGSQAGASARAEEEAPEQKDAGDEADVEPEGQGEAIENTYDSKYVAPHSENAAQAEEPKVAAKADPASSRALGSRIVPPDHSSEREAE